MKRGLLASLVLLAAAGSLRAQDDQLIYGDSAGFFGQGRANRHYTYKCSLCGQGFWIPTGSHSEASSWVANHKRGHGVGGGASGPAGGGSSLEESATRAMVEGIKHRDGQLFMMGAGAHLLNGLMNNLFSSGSGSADLEREREFRAAEERRRLEEIARREEMERMARIARAAEFREDWDRRDAAMAQALDGVFDVVRSPRSTPFFGEPAESAVPVEAPATPAVPSPVPNVAAPIYSSDVVVLGSDSMTVNPSLLAQGAVRAAETRSHVDGLSRWEFSPDPRTQPERPRLEALKNLGGLMVDDVKEMAIEGLSIPGLSHAVTTYSAVKDFSEDLFKKLGSMDLSDPAEVKKWEFASEQMGRDLLRDAWGDPSRRHEKYSEALEQLWTGVKR
jgi:hypothetical protein